MRRSFTSLSGAIAFVIAAAVTAIAASPTAVPSTAPEPSNTCVEPETIDPIAAFAYTIDDPRSLALIDFVEKIPASDRAAVAKRAALPESRAEADEFARAMQGSCEATRIDYQTVRLEYGVANRWSADEALDLESAAKRAMTALLLGDRVSLQARDGALGVFGTSTALLDARLASAVVAPDAPSATSARCTGTIYASAPRPRSPGYPPEAIAKGETGQIQTKVSLDVHGYVRSTTLFDSKIQPAGSSGSSLILATIVAAGTSDYTPAFRACRPIEGGYIFKADFSR